MTVPEEFHCVNEELLQLQQPSWIYIMNHKHFSSVSWLKHFLKNKGKIFYHLNVNDFLNQDVLSHLPDILLCKPYYLDIKKPCVLIE